MRKRYFLFILLLTTLHGCAVQKAWTATGGSKADGIVTLSYELGRFQKPVLDYAEGANIAARRCHSWGYKSAEEFGGENRNCINFSGSGCITMQVNKNYQCVN